MTQIRHQKRDVPVASLLGLLGAALPMWLPCGAVQGLRPIEIKIDISHRGKYTPRNRLSDYLNADEEPK